MIARMGNREQEEKILNLPGSSRGKTRPHLSWDCWKRESLSKFHLLCVISNTSLRANVSGPLCARHHGNLYVYSLICSPQKPREVDDCFSTFWLQAIGTQLLLTVNKKGLLGSVTKLEKGQGWICLKKSLEKEIKNDLSLPFSSCFCFS